MTNDELLAKMLDGTISPAEKAQLTSEALKNATLAEAIEQLQRVEALLAQSPHSYSAATDEFLKSIEDEIAEKVRDNRRKPVPILPPYIDTKWNWNILLYSISAIITVGAAGYFGYTALTTSSKKTQANPTMIAQEQVVNQPMPNAPAPENQPSKQNAQPLANQPNGTISKNSIPSNSQQQIPYYSLEQKQLNKPEMANQSSQQLQSQAPVTPTIPTPKNANNLATNGQNEVEGSTASSGSNKTQQMINSLSTQLIEKHASGDKIGEMALNKQIGMLYSKSGNHDDALRYLETALTHSRSVNAKNDEGLILGEIGLLESKFGYKETAAAKLQQAIDILTKSGMNHDKFKQELSKIAR